MSNQTITSGLAHNDRLSSHEGLSSGVSRLSRLARRLILFKLNKLQHGAITLLEGKERYSFGQLTSQCPLQATVIIHDPHTYIDVALAGTVGVGDAYRRGLWDCDDLTTLVRIFVLNRSLLNNMEGGLALASKPLLKTIHWLNRN
ncbi:MAG: hypothetical protein HP492_01930, partial [Nitrospira sp.]|nr:hypothetical protein [Nitrospira sp.]